MDDIRKGLENSLRQTFESVPPEMWCGMAALLLQVVKDLSIEYYEKGQEELRRRMAEMLELFRQSMLEED